MTKLRFAVASVFAVVLVLGISACSPGKLDVSDVTAIIDTRSAESFANSHIVGSVNVPYVEGEFIIKVVELSRSGKFYVYGTTDAEAGKAMGDMQSLSFIHITNLGTFENAQRILPLGVTP